MAGPEVRDSSYDELTPEQRREIVLRGMRGGISDGYGDGTPNPSEADMWLQGSVDDLRAQAPRTQE